MRRRIHILKGKVEGNGTLFGNILSLFFLQGFAYILPLILLPYLVRTLGVENFGLLAFATATVVFFRGIVSYGFELSGTKQISINRESVTKLNEIFSAIIFVKIILSALSFLLLVLLLVFVAKFKVNADVFLATFLLVIADIFYPVWFLQGVEKMKVMTYVQLTYKLIFLMSIILFVHNPQDYIYVPILDSTLALLAGIYTMYIIRKQFDISLKIPKLSDIKFQFYNGWYIFVSRISVIVYTSLNTFVLGLLTDNTSVGYYSLAEKLYIAGRSVLAPVYQALYPFLSKRYVESRERYYQLVRNLGIMNFISMAILSLLVYLFSAPLVKLIAGTSIVESTIVLNILALALFFSIGNFYSILLVIKSEDKILSKITLIIALVNIALVFPAISLYGIFGLAWLFVLVQVIQAFLQIKYNLEIWK